MNYNYNSSIVINTIFFVDFTSAHQINTFDEKDFVNHGILNYNNMYLLTEHINNILQKYAPNQSVVEITNSH